MRYEGRLYRPPSEAHSYILQATIGCSWNKCTYCDMYRDKEFRVREAAEIEADLAMAARRIGPHVDKVFVADGDALAMDLGQWRTVLEGCRRAFPNLRQVSCYAMATNVLEKSDAELAELRALGLSLLYIGPETGDPAVMKRIAKGSTPKDHIAAAERAHRAGMKLSAIFLLGAGGEERSAEHAAASAKLASAMDPEYLAALTLTIVPGTPMARLEDRGGFSVPEPPQLLQELRAFVGGARPSDALFRTNHASNYLQLGGRLPHDAPRIIEAIDAALAGDVPLTPDWARGL
ncbi:MAG: radical SAM protein [Planctomycetota bacterium]